MLHSDIAHKGDLSLGMCGQLERSVVKLSHKENSKAKHLIRKVYLTSHTNPTLDTGEYQQSQ